MCILPGRLNVCGRWCDAGSAATQRVVAACIEAVAALIDIHGVCRGSQPGLSQVDESTQAAVLQVGTVQSTALLSHQSAPHFVLTVTV